MLAIIHSERFRSGGLEDLPAKKEDIPVVVLVATSHHQMANRPLLTEQLPSVPLFSWNVLSNSTALSTPYSPSIRLLSPFTRLVEPQTSRHPRHVHKLRVYSIEAFDIRSQTITTAYLFYEHNQQGLSGVIELKWTATDGFWSKYQHR